jgi:hypothetical protein
MPGCGEPVSPFAAGCAICGTDLEAARAKRTANLTANRRAVPALPRWPRIDAGLDPLQVAIAVVLAVAAPPFGLLLSLFWAVQRQRAGEQLMAAVMLGAALLAAAAFFAPGWFGRVL